MPVVAVDELVTSDSGNGMLRALGVALIGLILQSSQDISHPAIYQSTLCSYRR